VAFWTKQTGSLPGANVLSIVCLVMNILLIHGYGLRLSIQGDYLEYTPVLGRKRAYFLNDIGRIERFILSSAQAPSARLQRYRFIDKNNKTMFLLDETSINMDRLWDAIDMYGRIHTFYDQTNKQEFELVSSYREEEDRYGVHEEDMETAGISFVIRYTAWIRGIFVVCGAFFVVATVLPLFWLSQDPTLIGASLCFFVFVLVCLLGFIATSRWHVKVEDETLFVHGSFGSKKNPKKIAVSSVTECRRTTSGTIKLYDHDRKILSVDPVVFCLLDDGTVCNVGLFILFLRDRKVSMPRKTNPGIGEL
jgi:hypothetical protein